MSKVTDFSVQAAKEEALAEIRKERNELAKVKIKTKLQEIETAKLIVANLERELEALEHELAAGV